MGGLFSKPKMPKVEPPTPLPDEDAQSDARRRRVAKEVNTSGKGSTNLTSGGRETLGA